MRLRKTLKTLSHKGIGQPATSGQLGKFLSQIFANTRLTVRFQEFTANLWAGASEPRIVLGKSQAPPAKLYLRAPAFEFANTDHKLHLAGLAKECYLTANYRRDTGAELHDSPVKVSVVPTSTEPRHLQRARTFRGPSSKAKDQEQQQKGRLDWDNAFIALGQGQKSPERGQTARLCMERPSLPARFAEEKRTQQQAIEGKDEASGDKIESVILFRCGGGYAKEGVFKVVYDKFCETGNLVSSICY